MEQYFQLVSETEVVDAIEIAPSEMGMSRETMLFVQANRQPIFTDVLSVPAYNTVAASDGQAGVTVYEEGEDKSFVKTAAPNDFLSYVTVSPVTTGFSKEVILFVQGSGSVFSDPLPPVTPPAPGSSGFYWG